MPPYVVVDRTTGRILRHDDERVNEVHERLVGQPLERRAVPPLDSAGGVEAIPADLWHLQSADALMWCRERHHFPANQAQTFMPAETPGFRS